MKIRLVVATRSRSKDDFLKNTATGRSISIHRLPFLELRLFYNNSSGLPVVYNQAIRESASDPATLVFMHDDVLVTDFYAWNRIREGLKKFDIIGVAGNKRRLPGQPAWAFINDRFEWDSSENLSGLVGHGADFPPKNLSFYGRSRQPVKLLDGVFLAVESEMLQKNAICFDDTFKFHHYDMDFCRQAEAKNLACGTWDISVIHASGGRFGTPEWRSSLERYLKKWGS